MNRFGGRAVISTGPGADPDSLYIAKLGGGKGLSVAGCPPRLDQRSKWRGQRLQCFSRRKPCEGNEWKNLPVRQTP